MKFLRVARRGFTNANVFGRRNRISSLSNFSAMSYTLIRPRRSFRISYLDSHPSQLKKLKKRRFLLPAP